MQQKRFGTEFASVGFIEGLHLYSRLEDGGGGERGEGDGFGCGILGSEAAHELVDDGRLGCPGASHQQRRLERTQKPTQVCLLMPDLAMYALLKLHEGAGARQCVLFHTHRACIVGLAHSYEG